MLRLTSILYSMIGTAMAGTAVVAVLTMGMTGWQPIVIAAAIGAALALPVSLGVARALQ